MGKWLRSWLSGALILSATLATGVATSTSAHATNCASGGICAVGDTGPGGGIVYYVSQTPFACGPTLAATCNDLEVAPNTWSGGSVDGTYHWDNDPGTGVIAGINQDGSPNNSASQLGLGLKNSNLIEAAWNASNVASYAARHYTGGGQSDWYVPTLVEDRLLCQFAHGQVPDITVACDYTKTSGLNTGVPSGFTFSVGSYQSSSQSGSPGNAQWHENFTNGGNDGNPSEQSTWGYRQTSYYTRPIRAFYSGYSTCAPTQTQSGSNIVVTFTSATPCGWTVPANVTTISLLIVGGGGGGGGDAAGGGGGGGLYYNASYSVTPSAAISISAGVGGQGGHCSTNCTPGISAYNGNSSNFGSLSVIGGGYGGLYNSGWGNPGGSGGGGAYSGGHGGATSLSGTYYFGNTGGAASSLGGGGGGGAGAAGTSSAGGAGKAISITGSSVYYAGGGGGGVFAANAQEPGGLGGGGAGSADCTNTTPSAANPLSAQAGAPNTGGGGGGAPAGCISSGAAGGSGVVILSYLSTAPTFTSLSVTTGLTTGNTTTIITGTNLANTETVTVGGATAALGTNTATSLTITTPAGTSGPKDLIITTAQGSVTASGAFIYTNPLTYFPSAISTPNSAFQYGSTFTVSVTFPADAIAGNTGFAVLKASTAVGINGAGDQVCSVTGATIIAGGTGTYSCSFNSQTLWPNGQPLAISGFYVLFNGSTYYPGYTSPVAGNLVSTSASPCGLAFCPDTATVSVTATSQSIQYGTSIASGYADGYGNWTGGLRYTVNNGANGQTTIWGVLCTTTYTTGSPVGQYPITCSGTSRPSGAPSPVTDAWVNANTNYAALVSAGGANLYSESAIGNYSGAANWWTRGSVYTSDTYSNLTFNAGSLTVTLAPLTVPSTPTATAVNNSGSSITVSFSAIPNAASYQVNIYAADGTTLIRSVSNFTSGAAISGLSATTTYKVAVKAIGDGVNTSSSAFSQLATVTTNATPTYSTTYVPGLGATGSVPLEGVHIQGETFTVSTAPNLSHPGFYIDYWSDGFVDYHSGDTYTVGAQSITLTPTWRQNSLRGVLDSDLTYAGTIASSNVNTTTQTVSAGSSSVSVQVPSGAFANPTNVTIDNLNTSTFAQSLISSTGSYVVNLVVSWLAADGTVPTATSPIVVTINNSTIQAGAAIYEIINGSATAIGTVTQSGQAVLNLTTDPIVEIINPAPPVSAGTSNIQDPRQTAVITSVTPSVGSTSSATTVAISGTFGKCNVKNISVDGEMISSATWMLTPTGIALTMPAHTPKSVQIQIYDGCAPLLDPISFNYLEAQGVSAPTPTPVLAPTSTPTPAVNAQPAPSMKLFAVIHFALNAFKLTTQNQLALTEIATRLKTNPGHLVLIYGHADSQPGVSNALLSKKRAQSVESYLAPLLSGKKINLGWYASTKPAVAGNGQSANAANRRVEIWVK